MSSSSAPLKVGVFLAESGVQTLDITPLDVLGLLDPKWASVVGLSEDLVAQAVKMEYFFVSETGESPHPLTAGFKIAVTVLLAISPFPF